MFRLIQWLSIGCVILVLAGRALELRLPQLSRPLWEDEVHHNYFILTAPTVREMQAETAGQFQPCLDYLLRRWLWFPVLGPHELSFRLPSLAYSLLTVLAGFTVALLFFRRESSSWVWALGLSFLAAMWIVNHPVEIHYAAEGRHYSLVALLSLVWAAVYFLPGRPRPLALLLASLLFANAHFFALVLLVPAYVMEAVAAFRQKQYRQLGICAVAVALIFLVHLGVNKRALNALLHHPPAPVGDHGLWQVLAAGGQVWLSYLSYLAVPGSILVLLLILLIGWRKPTVSNLLVLLLGVLPLFFVYVRCHSAYAFDSRYMTPFFGLGFVVILFSLQFAQQLVQRGLDLAQARFSHLAVLRSPVPAGALLTAAVGAVLFVDVSNRACLARPALDFSPYYRIYEGLKRERAPLFVLHSRTWSSDIPLLYLEVIAPPYNAPMEVASSVGGITEPGVARRKLETFLAAHPDGVIALDQTPVGIPPELLRERSLAEETAATQQLLRQIGEGLMVEEVRPFPHFIWTIKGAHNLADVARVATAVQFRSVTGIFP